MSLVVAEADPAALVTADLRSEAADAALTALESLSVPADDIALVRLETIASESGTDEVSPLISATSWGRHARERAHRCGTSC